MSNSYTFDEVFEATKNYFGGDDLAAATFFKYVLCDDEDVYYEKTPEDAINRYAKEIHRIDCKYPKPIGYGDMIYLLDHYKRVILGGSPMAGIGNDFSRMSLSNCVVAPSPEDNISSIFDVAKMLAIFFSRRMGAGLNLSTLRPAGDAVSNAAKTTTGAWSFASLYSFVCRLIGQNNRRGALMLTMLVSHPDIEKFITMKRNLTDVTGANISVLITDDFMTAVEEDGDWDLVFNGKVRRTVKAVDIWNLIIENATAAAEPGVLFWDTYKKYNPLNEYPGFKMISTNPCQPGFAYLQGAENLITMYDVKVGDEIWSPIPGTKNAGQFSKVVRKVSSGIKDVYRYRTTFGEFIGTEDHKVYDGGSKVKAKDAMCLDRAVFGGTVFNNHQLLNPEYIMYGLLLGDGSVHKASNNKVILYIGDEDQDYFNDLDIKHLIVGKTGIGEKAYAVDSNISPEVLVRTYDRSIPKEFMVADKVKVRSLLRGIYSANGSIINGKGKRISLKSASLDMITDVQLLLSSLGISSYYTTNKESTVLFPNGEYVCKQSYDLNITTDMNKFFALIGFIQHYKMCALVDVIENKKKASKIRGTQERIVSIEYLGKHEVFDITVDSDYHTYLTGGSVVGNCGELGLSGNAGCMLSSINLRGFVLNPYTPEATFDAEGFESAVRKTIRMMDDMIDLELEALDKVIAKADTQDVKDIFKLVQDVFVKGRRIGLGTTALADCLIALGISYGSEDSKDTIDYIYSMLEYFAYDESVNLAIERGPFPIFDWNTEKDNLFIVGLPLELREKIKKYGRRHGALLTNAPVGSGSILGQCSSGIEPVFDLYYTRRKKLTGDITSERVDYTDANGDKWQFFTVVHPEVMCYMRNEGIATAGLDRIATESLLIDDLPADFIEAVKELPDYFVTSSGIKWEDRVEIQAIITSHLDHNCSSTVNLPEGTTPEVVSGIYKTAWKSGCKGITVYVQGSRDGVLVSASPCAKTLDEWYDRPEALFCEVHYIEATFDKVRKPYAVIVSFKDDIPFEIFGGEYSAEEVSSQFPPYVNDKVMSGLITKKELAAGAKYTLTIEGNGVIQNLGGEFHYGQTATINRVMSLCLRSRPDNLIHLIKQISKDRNYAGYMKAVGRVLKKYIPDGTSSRLTCPQCGQKTLRYEGGCTVCQSCGYSGCS
jgi:ribonucleotide reductase alpha subunit